MQVKDRVAIVTGGSNGIGAALCRQLAKENAKAVVVADVDVQGAQTLAREIGGVALKCDVSQEEEIFKMVQQTEEECGPVDLFFSNAGIMIQGLLNVSNADWQRIWEINVMSHIYGARAVIPKMLERGFGGFRCRSSVPWQCAPS